MADLVPIAANPGFAPALGAGSPLERLRGLAAQPALRKALPWFLGAGALGTLALTWAILSPAPQRTLYTELNDSERAGVVAALDKAAIGYTIDNATGALTVAEDDLYRARMLVASDGALATPETGADALNSLPLGASRTLEGERLKTARERELQQTIMEIDGVEAVRIHLAQAEKSVFVREDTPPSASVMLRLARGRRLSDSQTAAIINLVAASVPGLSPDAVRVVDQHGRLLSDGSGKDNDQIELQARLEEKLRGQLEQLLTPMLGAGNFTSEVQVELDMNEVTSARESYDKDGVVRTETQQQSQSTGPTGAIGVPGVLSNTPPPATTAVPGAPTGTPAGGATTPSNGESSSARTFELGREVAVSNSGPGKVKRLSVAVALSQAALKKAKPEDIEQIKQLISAAVGANLQRGDQVSVLARPFEPVSAEEQPFYEAGWFAMVVRNGVALIAVLLVLLLGVRPLIAALKRRNEALAAPAEAIEPQAERQTDADGEPLSDAELINRQIGLAQRIALEKPDDAARALREMLAAPAPEPAEEKAA
jgi:flagellar M-ring protein FliF